MIRTNDPIFAIGPAGSGKTYTAIALAVRALRNKEVKRIILTRPAVEAVRSSVSFPEMSGKAGSLPPASL
jgi:phosphate starvation-inducible protein PhoH